jgi:hypothetical protein
MAEENANDAVSCDCTGLEEKVIQKVAKVLTLTDWQVRFSH